MAATLLLRGTDPHHHLRVDDPVELALIGRAQRRANELRQQELDYLARTIRNEIAQAFRG